jgi:hypothetical protein
MTSTEMNRHDLAVLIQIKEPLTVQIKQEEGLEAGL